MNKQLVTNFHNLYVVTFVVVLIFGFRDGLIPFFSGTFTYIVHILIGHERLTGLW